MKKKSRIWRGTVILAMALCICGCGNAGGVQDDSANTGSQVPVTGTVERDAEESNAEESGAGDSKEEEGRYFFETNGVKVCPDMDMDELAGSLGESRSVYTVPSCTGDGVTYIYSFSGYEISTYPAPDGKNRIGYITFKDDTVATPEGVDLSMKKADVISVYGEDYQEDDNKMITYEDNGVKLSFIFDEDIIVSIEYASSVIG